MVSAVTTEKFASRNKVQMFFHDPDGTGTIITTPDGETTKRWVDMRDYGGFAVQAMSVVLTGNGITLLEIVADVNSDGSGTNRIIKSSGAVVADAVGDYVVVECLAEEIAQIGEDNSEDLRYVAARLTVANSADEAVVNYIQFFPRFPATGLTADAIA